MPAAVARVVVARAVAVAVAGGRVALVRAPVHLKPQLERLELRVQPIGLCPRSERRVLPPHQLGIHRMSAAPTYPAATLSVFFALPRPLAFPLGVFRGASDPLYTRLKI